MYMTPGGKGGGGPGSPHHGHPPISDAPIARFAELIEDTPVNEWQKRTTALQQLVDSIPEGSAYLDGLAWYNSPPTLRRLSPPLSELLKDARSTVVKRTCASMSQLFTKCQREARYLFRDLMPVVLSVHAQTAQVIRQAVQNMVLEAISEVPCKMVMPLWMERLKIDKSRTVRDACSIYLGQALQCWTEEGYLTDEIWLQVGKTLISTLRDPSPSVRGNSKGALDRIRQQEPDIWDRLVNDPDGPASKDRKLQKWLKSLGQDSPDAEELSVASRFSYNSDIRGFGARSTTGARSSYSPSSNKLPPTTRPPSRVVDEDNRSGGYGGVPMSIAVAANGGGGGGETTASSYKRNGLGPPLRRINKDNAAQQAQQPSPPPPRVAAAARTPPSSSTATPTHEPSRAFRPQESDSFSDFAQILDIKKGPPPPSSPMVKTTEPGTTTTTSAEKSASTEYRDKDALKLQHHAISELKKEEQQQQPKVDESNSTNNHAADTSIQIQESSSFPADLNLPALRQTFARSTTPKAASSSSSNSSSSPTTKVVKEEEGEDNSGKAMLSRANALISEEPVLSNPSMESKASSHHSHGELRSVSSTAAVITTDKDVAAVVATTVSSSNSNDVDGSISNNNTASSTEEGPFVANMQELKKYSKRRTRNSLLIQERLRMSSSMSMLLEEEEQQQQHPKTTRSDEENAVPNPVGSGKPPVAPTPKQQPLPSHPEGRVTSPASAVQSATGTGAAGASVQAPEHMVIAIRLLKAHKEHVDAIMETLRIEMETLRDFDQLLEEPGRPTEEEVLDYFESVGICLEQRTLAGSQLQREMDLVSRGEPPQD